MHIYRHPSRGPRVNLSLRKIILFAYTSSEIGDADESTQWHNCWLNFFALNLNRLVFNDIYTSLSLFSRLRSSEDRRIRATCLQEAYIFYPPRIYRANPGAFAPRPRAMVAYTYAYPMQLQQLVTTSRLVALHFTCVPTHTCRLHYMISRTSVWYSTLSSLLFPFGLTSPFFARRRPINKTCSLRNARFPSLSLSLSLFLLLCSFVYSYC